MWKLAHKIGNEDYKSNQIEKIVEVYRSHISALNLFHHTLMFLIEMSVSTETFYILVIWTKEWLGLSVFITR